jgi:hypothetical protein
MNARLHDFIKTKPLKEIKQMCVKYNNLYCRPPLEKTEFEHMWSDASIHVAIQEQEKDSSSNGASGRTNLISVAGAIRYREIPFEIIQMT